MSVGPRGCIHQNGRDLEGNNASIPMRICGDQCVYVVSIVFTNRRRLPVSRRFAVLVRSTAAKIYAAAQIAYLAKLSAFSGWQVQGEQALSADGRGTVLSTLL